MIENTGRIRTKSLFLLCLISGISLFLPLRLASQNNEIQNYISNRIPVDNQNWKIFQSPLTGYIYFANSAGLVEYNGISSKIYTLPYHQGIRSVYVNSKGTVFTGSFEDFGYWEKDSRGEMTYHSLNQDFQRSKNDEIWNIFELNGTVYFQSFTTIYTYNYQNVNVIHAPSTMLFQFRVEDKFIVQGIGQGLYWFNGSTFEFIKGSELFKTANVLAVIDYKYNNYWICTANNGIYVYDGKTFTQQKSEISDFLKVETCNAGLSINDSLIVFGTILKGLVFCDEKGKIQKTYDYSNGLRNNTVLSLFKSPDNGLWVGLDEGVNYINVSSPVTLFSNTTGDLGTIYSAIRDNNSLYLGTNHGLFVTNIINNRGDYSFTDLKIIPNTQGQVWQLAQFDDQILCGHNDGTLLLEKGGMQKISDVTGGWSIKQYNDILLEGTYTGIISFKKKEGKWSFRNRIEGYYEPTRFIEVDYLGYVWAIHPQKGIYRLELNENADSVINKLYFNSLTNIPNRLTMSRINNQVVFMTSDYIYAFDYENKSFLPVKSLESGLGEYIKATQIINYQKNNYWFVLGNRIALFNISKDLKAEKVIEFFHKYTEVPWLEQQIILLDKNTLLIPTRQAFTIFNLTRLNNEKEEKALEINKLVFKGKSAVTTIFPGISKNPSLPNRENNLTVFMADPSGFDLEEKEYLYRITELGEQWYRTMLDNFSFLNLNYGNYHLQVKHATGSKITEAEFMIRRPQYMSIVALIIYLIIVIALILAGIKVFHVELDRHRKLIEYEAGKNKLENELDYKSYELMLTMRYLIRKTDVLRELHDKLDALKAYSSKFPVKYIKEMERIIDHGLDTQTEEWQNVMKNLKLSQEGFFRKLKDKYPSLTPNDLRLCSYLRMNFTTKEIANLVNISSRAIEIGRYRLRRKMNLDHDINLTEFLIKESETL